MSRNPNRAPEPTELYIEAQVAREIFSVLQRLNADPKLLSVIGNWRDTLDDGEVLWMLREYNATGEVPDRPQ